MLALQALLALFPLAYCATIDVTVGGPGILKYNPEFVTANPGDVVRFTFQQKNHTATQSTLQSPCTAALNGFDSGFVPVGDSVVSGFPVAELKILNSDPIWVYCRQANHCQQGMVFAVNPGNDFAAFQTAATGSTPPSSVPAGGIVTVTQTVTVSGQVETTTYATYPSASATSVSSDHRVIVGGPGMLLYDPANITAQVGDTVTFEFHQKNHTITASSFNSPCEALSLTSTIGEAGFNSGFMPVADNATIFPTFTIQINDTKPIWAYCRQTGHCGQGMVFSVNSIETGPQNFAAFKARAIQLNGTTTASGSSGNAAISSVKLHGASTVVALVALAAALL